MNESKIAVRYAKALFSLAKEENVLKEIYNDLQNLNELILKTPELQYLISDPVMKQSKKAELFNLIFKNSVHKLTLNFIHLILENKREQYLESIARVFMRLFRQESGIQSVIITTAAPVDGKLKKVFSDMLSGYFKSDIELEEKVDEKIIGGFKIRFEDRQLDASVATQLGKIKKELLTR
ncbi:MAG: ATP synthase F1 subunit delta [Bacteroidales bacterium]|nr:ATP synthase F1 subunit delta [Bacteroidales bacterium]